MTQSRHGERHRDPAAPRLLLVDFENVPRADLSRLDDSYDVVIFVGMSQKSVPIELVTATQNLGSRVEWQKVSGEGRNALDFFIAWQLGRVFERAERPECIVLSMDKGFEPLLKHLNAAGMKCRRVSSLAELGPTPQRHEPVRQHQQPSRPAQQPARQSHATRPAGYKAADPNVERALEVLGRSTKRSRPRKRKTLAQAISAMFQRSLTRDEVDRIIDELRARGDISEANGVITYHT